MPNSQGLDIPETTRKRSLILLQVTNFLNWVGFSVVVPLIGVHYVDGLGWAAAAVGLALAIRQFLHQGLTVFSGALADRLGAKWLIAGGILVRAAGMAMLAWADSYPLLMASMVTAAIGGAIFDSPEAAAIAALTTEQERPRYFAIAGVLIGIGIALGAQLGTLLMNVDFALVAYASGASYLLIFLLVALLLPPVRVAQEAGGFWTGFGLALRDRPFVAYTSLMTGQWFMSTQFFMTLPLAVVGLTGRVETIAWVTGLNSAVTVILGYPLPRWFERRMGSRGALVAGTVVTVAAMLSIAAARNLPMLLAAVFLFAAGTTLVRPNEQTVAAGLANRAALGSYFGVAAMSVGFGGGLGNVAGGYLYDRGTAIGFTALPWLVCAAVGTVTAVGLWLTLRPREHRRTQAVAAGD